VQHLHLFTTPSSFHAHGPAAAARPSSISFDADLPHHDSYHLQSSLTLLEKKTLPENAPAAISRAAAKGGRRV